MGALIQRAYSHCSFPRGPDVSTAGMLVGGATCPTLWGRNPLEGHLSYHDCPQGVVAALEGSLLRQASWVG